MELEISSQERRRDHVSIEIVPHEDLISSIKQKMDYISLSHCVCRVPGELFKGNEEKYFPNTVSIGPFHHGKESLKAMEGQKWKYFNTLLSRKPNTDSILEDCVKALRQVEQKARKFYGETIEVGSDQFIEIMLVDGCFIIEFLIKFAIKSLRRRDDPCFSTNDNVFRLRCDLILLENQLPFFILELLFHLVPIPKQCTFSLIELAFRFFQKLIPLDQSQFPIDKIAPETHHLLDLIRQYYLPRAPHNFLPSSGGQKRMPSATQLRHLGIHIEKSFSETPLNITFFDGELEIPPLKIHDYTEILFRNLIAMEFCQLGCPKHVTSYVILMERLVRSKRDVRLLYGKRILINGEEDDGAIVILFKKLLVDVKLKEFDYRGMCEQINSHQKRRGQIWWMNVRHIYHRTRLGIAGLSLAVLLLVFLFTGALFTSLSFLLHHFQ